MSENKFPQDLVPSLQRPLSSELPARLPRTVRNTRKLDAQKLKRVSSPGNHGSYRPRMPMKRPKPKGLAHRIQIDMREACGNSARVCGNVRVGTTSYRPKVPTEGALS